MTRRHTTKVRLDTLLAERGLAPSREAARRLVMAGVVSVNDQTHLKPGTRIKADAKVTVRQRPRFVSRGGDKLAAAIHRFQVNPAGWVCADVGASTGGFTDCLLQAGAARVYAVDVGYGQLAWSLRQDERVVVIERANARYIERLPEPVRLVVIDVSFISVTLILPVVRGWLAPGGELIILIKPQFEAGPDDVGRGGVVRDPAVHRRVLTATIQAAEALGYEAHGLMPSPLRGPAGNIEFLLWLACDSSTSSIDSMKAVDPAITEAHAAHLG